MGCGSTKEKIENEMIAMKLERVGIQMERRNQIKLLEEMDGRKIKEPTIPDYSVLSPKEKNIFPAKSKLGNKETENRGRSKSVDFKKKIKSIKTNSTTGLESKKNIKGNKTLKKISK